MPYSLILGTNVVAEDNSIHVQITVCVPNHIFNQNTVEMGCM